MKFFRLFVLTAILLTINSIGFSQVGINTIAPDSSASLHIVSKPSGSGLLIPRLTQAQRLAIFNPAKGLMVFDLSANLFYMNMDSAVHNWYVINPWLTRGNNSGDSILYTSSVVSKVGIGTSNPSANLDVVGDIKASTSVTANTLNVNSFPTNALVPAGAIMLWSGTSAPSGWALCDGGGGRPDLRGRFVVGFDAGGSLTPLAAPTDGTTTNYGAVKNTGGETGHILTKGELPKHQHTVNSVSTDNGQVLISSTGTTDTYSASGWDSFFNTGSGSPFYNAAQYPTHTHTISGSTGDGTTDVLNNQAHENRPPYYVLAYIIKLP